VHESLRSDLTLSDFPKEVHPIIHTIDGYFGTADNPSDLSTDDLANLFFASHNKDPEFYQSVFEAIKKDESSVDSTAALIQGLQQVRLLRELSLDAYDSSEGRKDLSAVLAKLQELTVSKESSEKEEEFEFACDDIEQIQNDKRAHPGLRWRLKALNRMLGSIRRSNFGFIFARPETGKTTFLASEVTFMAEQIPDDGGPILWFNNEQDSADVIPRLYQASLGIDDVALYADMKGNREKYYRQTKGKIKFVDSASISKSQVEKMCKKFKPSLILFDQIDKIKGFDADREDLRLGAIYIWARELAKMYCPVIGVCQADGNAEGVQWLNMGHVANAKTSKQAEADWILGIGRRNEPGYDQLRFLHLSKNKLPGDADSERELRHGRLEVLIHPDIARYGDL
jgi:replicative DNA helicase